MADPENSTVSVVKLSKCKLNLKFKTFMRSLRNSDHFYSASETIDLEAIDDLSDERYEEIIEAM